MDVLGVNLVDIDIVDVKCGKVPSLPANKGGHPLPRKQSSAQHFYFNLILNF